jgi:predicted dehydrogenase
MSISMGIVGAGLFGPEFTQLFQLHPDVRSLYVTDLIPERSEAVHERLHLTGVFPSFEAMLESDVDAVGIFTQRWTHGPLVVQALRAGKHVYSAVPMASSLAEIEAIIEAVKETGLVYMMGETSYYNPAAVFARQKVASREFGRVFYSEGDYVHDIEAMYLGFQNSGGEHWKSLASFPPMLYPTHALGGVLSVLPARAVSVSCIGVHDDGDDAIFDRSISAFDNDFSNETALFELADGGIVRTNEMRRVGYPTQIRESRFRFFGTRGSFEQIAEVSVWQDNQRVYDVTDLLSTKHSRPSATAGGFSWESGYARVQDTSRLPRELLGAPNGHEGVHHFLVDDFVRAVNTRTLPVINAWEASRYTVPGIFAHQSAMHGAVRLDIPDLGVPPMPVGTRVAKA